MENTEKKEFRELSEEQLQEVTGGLLKIIEGCILDHDSCPSGKFDKQCKCLG